MLNDIFGKVGVNELNRQTQKYGLGDVDEFEDFVDVIISQWEMKYEEAKKFK